MTVLAGDIGGTKTLLGLGDADGSGVRWLRKARFASAQYAGLEEMLAAFLRPGERPTAACLAVAGPIEYTPGGARTHVTNLPWTIDTDALGATLGAPVRLVNDFQGVAHGIAHLPAQDLTIVQAGRPEHPAVRAVLGAGTGLGMAIMVPVGSTWQVLASEGGHTDFAPQGALQEDFARWLRARERLDHLSCERVLSGPGIEALYAYLSDASGAPSALGAPEVSAAATQGNPHARLALDEFTRIYGAQAGNLALMTLPYGGLYLAGGIAPAHAALLTGGLFMQAFLAKGRFRALLERVPVRIVTDPEVGLLGAAALALQMAARAPSPCAGG